MLIRFTVQNIFSFAGSEEFNMLPWPEIRTPEGHKYALDGIELLKLSAIYGANAAGKIESD
jgi:AAA15 family ATPase/GTPase